MTEYILTNVEQNDDGTVNITGMAEDGTKATFCNAFPVSCGMEGEPVCDGQTVVEIPISYTIPM